LGNAIDELAVVETVEARVKRENGAEAPRVNLPTRQVAEASEIGTSRGKSAPGLAYITYSRTSCGGCGYNLACRVTPVSSEKVADVLEETVTKR
jgi:hypothetical protein